MITSVTGLRIDLRSVTFGLLSFEVLCAGFGEDVFESASELSVLVWRAARDAAGDFFWGISELPALCTNSHMPISFKKKLKFRSKIHFQRPKDAASF